MSTDDKKVDPNDANGEEEEAYLKIILLGDSMVGKSKLVERFLMSNYEPKQMSTYGLTMFRHMHNIDDKEVAIDFWDTAGQERFASMHPSYYHRAHACILVFDVTRKATYKHLASWYKELTTYRSGIPTIVVANKIDANPDSTKKKFSFASSRGLPFHFCSAADGTNVMHCFEDAIELALSNKEDTPKDYMAEVMETLDYFDQKEKAETTEAKTDE